MLLLTGTRRSDLSTAIGRHARFPYDSLPAGCKWMGVIDGATHMNFAGVGFAGTTEKLTLLETKAFLDGLRGGKCGRTGAGRGHCGQEQVAQQQVRPPCPVRGERTRGKDLTRPYFRKISCINSELMISRISARFSPSCCAACFPPRILSRAASPLAARPSIAAWFLYSMATQISQSSGVVLGFFQEDLVIHDHTLTFFCLRSGAWWIGEGW